MTRLLHVNTAWSLSRRDKRNCCGVYHLTPMRSVPLTAGWRQSKILSLPKMLPHCSTQPQPPWPSRCRALYHAAASVVATSFSSSLSPLLATEAGVRATASCTYRAVQASSCAQAGVPTYSGKRVGQKPCRLERKAEVTCRGGVQRGQAWPGLCIHLCCPQNGNLRLLALCIPYYSEQPSA